MSTTSFERTTTVAASAPPAVEQETTTTPNSTVFAPTTSTLATPETTLADVVVPEGILAAIPYQDRKDVANNVFQVKIVNGAAERIDVVGVQFDWAGLATSMEPRDSTAITPQRRIDLPLPLPAATCLGDGTAATMPDPSSGIVRLALGDGTMREVPVFDTFHVARRLYLADCERQLIERMIDVEWVDVAAAVLDGRPASSARLRISRNESSEAVSLWSVSNTINYSLVLPPRPDGQPLTAVPQGEPEAFVDVHIVEGRCDAHALAESSQPFNFVVQLDLGDGVIRPLIVLPSPSDQPGIRQRAEAACVEFEKLTTTEGSAATTTPGANELDLLAVAVDVSAHH